MNPFELPPSSPPVGFDPPQRPRRGRLAAGIAVASLGLVVGGIALAGSLASADKPSIAAATPETRPTTTTAATTPDATTPETSSPGTTTPDMSTPGEADEGRPGRVFDGKVVIDVGTGEPIEIDLGDLPDFEQLNECLGLPLFDDFELPPVADVFDLPKIVDGGHVVVTGPDGVSVVDFGDGDGSVTITKSGDALTVESDGDVRIDELPQPPDLRVPEFELPDLDQIRECVDSSA